MSSLSLTVLVLFNFILIGLLPVFFFKRDGEFNLRWFATGSPFFVAPAALLLAWLGVLDLPSGFTAAQTLLMQGTATVLAGVSIALIAMTVGSHRVPLALWHQDNDAPVQIVTWGPYRHIRHPFYTSFLLAFTAAALAFPHVSTFICLAYSFLALSITAGREERRLEHSEFGEEYSRYMAVSGRFFPRLM